LIIIAAVIMGALCGPGGALRAVIGAIAGYALGSIGSTLYTAACPQAHGVMVRGFAALRSFR
jgi:hypothetical protein